MSGARLIRRGPDGSQEWSQQAAEELEEPAPRPTSRRVSFELPDGYMATISLVPYTETAVALTDAEPELPSADPALIA